MKSNIIFTDASLNPQLKIGIGGYLICSEEILNIEPDSLNKFDLVDKIIVNKFENTSSTKLEIETVLWAFDNIREKEESNNIPKSLYTDSQCITGLLNRKQRLLNSDFIAKSSGKELNNKELYLQFYEIQSKIGFEIIKVTGHSQKHTQNTIHRIFSFLDAYVRKSLKEWVKEME